MEVFQRGRPPGPDPKRVLVVGDRNALLCRERRAFVACDLMGFPAVTLVYRLISEMGGRVTAVFRVPCHGISSWSVGCEGGRQPAPWGVAGRAISFAEPSPKAVVPQPNASPNAERLSQVEDARCANSPGTVPPQHPGS